VKKIFLGMRVALKIAYDGREFHGHQRQRDARTVEGECLTALRSAKILRDPRESFFRSASRTDKGVSAVGNVIAFDSALQPKAVLGAFNDRARDVWAWAYAEVPERFHPRHALERWYRYHVFEDVAVDPLREAGSLFVGEHDFRGFTSDPPAGPFAINRIDVAGETEVVLVDIRARSFRRGMVRRIVAAMLSYARGDADLERIRRALRGERHEFGAVPPEPLLLMDVDYGFPFSRLVQPKVFDESHSMRIEARLRLRWLNALADASLRSRDE
jgi:tRNA pseudouridine38-40 synthase